MSAFSFTIDVCNKKHMIQPQPQPSLAHGFAAFVCGVSRPLSAKYNVVLTRRGRGPRSPGTHHKRNCCGFCALVTACAYTPHFLFCFFLADLILTGFSSSCQFRSLEFKEYLEIHPNCKYVCLYTAIFIRLNLFFHFNSDSNFIFFIPIFAFRSFSPIIRQTLILFFLCKRIT